MQPRRHEATKKTNNFFFVPSCLRGCVFRQAGVFRGFLLWVLFVLGAASAFAQVSTAATRLAVLQAEDRRAPTAADLATLRSGARGTDAPTVRVAVRALGRLERPALIPDLTAALRHIVPEVRVEAATAIGQASQGWKRGAPPAASAVDAVLTTLVARLKVDADAGVRAAICETVGRLPYGTAIQVENAERALLDMASRAESITDRLGVAKGFETLVRTHRKLRAPGGDALAVLRTLAVPGAGEPSTGARIRRLSLEALVTAGAVDDALVTSASRDPDAQVRRIVMRAAAAGPAGAATEKVLAGALADDSFIVRIEALRALHVRGAAEACAASIAAVDDRDVHVALVALDQLAACGASADAIAVLEREVRDLAGAAVPRQWHRAAHALVSLATASPDRVDAPLRQMMASRVWQLRMYAARAAAVIVNRDHLEQLANDDDDNVREAAVEGLKKIAGHAADAVYVAQLTRHGYQVVRAAALALDGTPQSELAVPALKSAWDRLAAEGRDNSHDARDAIAKALATAGGQTPSHAGSRPGRGQTPSNDLSTEELRRLASPRARITIRGVGTFELALFTVQAPATVMRFAHLAESGYYNGLTFHRVVPNFVIQGGSPGANEYIGDAMFLRDEVGSWPHVRGAVGISTRGRDTGDAQIFLDLVDNPRLDHEYTVFAQVLNGIDIVDRILEGDVIEKIEIVP
jgi:cyclophilin family peptidyl-prolyl cis-trans isomerase/HEAT repeat protein